MLKTSSLFVFALVLGIAGAQEKKPAAPAPKPAASAAAPAQPQPTELERTKIENIQLRMMLLQQEEQSIPQRKSELQQAYGEVIRQIQAEHPGYVWNPSTNGLVLAPKPEAKPAADTKK